MRITSMSGKSNKLTSRRIGIDGVQNALNVFYHIEHILYIYRSYQTLIHGSFLFGLRIEIELVDPPCWRNNLSSQQCTWELSHLWPKLNIVVDPISDIYIYIYTSNDSLTLSARSVLANHFDRRSVILMWITILMGGTYMMENPMNSLVACHPRYVWMVEKLQEIGVYVAHLGPCAYNIFPTSPQKLRKGFGLRPGLKSHLGVKRLKSNNSFDMLNMITLWWVPNSN